MLGRLFRGELTVAQTYWVGFVGFNIVLRVLFYALGGWQLRQMLNGNESFAINVTLVISTSAALWCLGMLRAQYIAMNRDRQPSFASWLGCVLICIGVVTHFGSVAKILNPSIKVGARAIYQEFDILNASLPQQAGPGVTIESAMFDGRTLLYVYAVEGESNGLTGNILMPQSEVDGVCADMEGYFKGPVEEVTFRYVFTNENVSRVITREECGMTP